MGNVSDSTTMVISKRNKHHNKKCYVGELASYVLAYVIYTVHKNSKPGTTQLPEAGGM
jgi:hypothetical protein